MASPLERLNEVERQVAATQVALIELEARSLLMDKAVGIMFATGKAPTEQQLTRFSAEVTEELKSKYPGLNVMIEPVAPRTPALFLPRSNGETPWQ